MGSGTGENGIQHGRGHASGECVLLTWVITADEQHFGRCLLIGRCLLTGRCLLIGQADLGTMTEPWTRPWQRESALAEYRPYGLPGISAQANDYSQVSDDKAQFGGKPGRARIPFGRFRLIVRR